jgi:hypothetical protein
LAADRRRRIPYPLAYGGEGDSLKLFAVLDLVKSISTDSTVVSLLKRI